MSTLPISAMLKSIFYADTRDRIEVELHISTWPVYALLPLIGLLTVIASDRIVVEPERMVLLCVALLCYVGSGGAWLLETGHPLTARWLLTVLVTVLINLGLFWLTYAGFVAPVAIPILVAMGLLGLHAAVVICITQSVLLLLGTAAGAVPGLAGGPLTFLVSTLATVWITFLLLVLMQSPMRQITVWSWQQYDRSRHLLDEARRRSQELTQVLEDLMHANRQLDLLNDRLDATRRLAEEAHKAKAAFVAKVSHEFRTPLNMIIGLTDLVMETPDVYSEQLPSALIEDLRIVHRNCSHLASIVNDVLDISQAESGRLALRREWVDLRRDIETSLVVVQPLIDKKKLTLHVCLDDNVANIFCDRTRIRQVLLNLVSNAALYTEQGSITIELTQVDQAAQVCVRDTGPGIPPTDVERIFDPFYQGENGVLRDRNGSGLGLTISRQFVELHGGKIWVESTLGSGSAFTFRLPTVPATAPQATSRRWLSEEWEWVERSERPTIPRLPYQERVVVYDESGELPRLFSDTNPEVEVVTVGALPEVERALADTLAHAMAINAANADHLLELMERARVHLPDTPVLGYVLPPQLDQPLSRRMDAGVLDYLIKPVTRADLRKVLHSLPTKPRRILIVDDDDDFRRLLTRMLHALDTTLEVSTAHDGQAAAAALELAPPDLIFLDLAMPNLDGWQLLTFKDSHSELRAIPVTIISALDPGMRPGAGDILMVTMEGGIPRHKLLPALLMLSNLLLQPDPSAAPTHD